MNSAVGDPREVLVGVVAEVLVQIAGDVVAGRGQHQGVAVRRGAGHLRRAYGAARAGAVFHHDGGVQGLAQFVTDGAGDGVLDGARAVRNDDADDALFGMGGTDAGKGQRQGKQGGAAYSLESEGHESGSYRGRALADCRHDGTALDSNDSCRPRQRFIPRLHIAAGDMAARRRRDGRASLRRARAPDVPFAVGKQHRRRVHVVHRHVVDVDLQARTRAAQAGEQSG
ncbi:hypothetical protein G6F35_014701 [Rhizopus arrhizus]|nr:hypothetical protein G6F35_014701 [Rhizopus arrhizus]